MIYFINWALALFIDQTQWRHVCAVAGFHRTKLSGSPKDTQKYQHWQTYFQAIEYHSLGIVINTIAKPGKYIC
jgi:hypothetical protein